MSRLFTFAFVATLLTIYIGSATASSTSNGGGLVDEVVPVPEPVVTEDPTFLDALDELLKNGLDEHINRNVLKILEKRVGKDWREDFDDVNKLCKGALTPLRDTFLAKDGDAKKAVKRARRILFQDENDRHWWLKVDHAHMGKSLAWGMKDQKWGPVLVKTVHRPWKDDQYYTTIDTKQIVEYAKLRGKHLEILPTADDGNCLWRAFSIGLGKESDEYFSLKQHALGHARGLDEDAGNSEKVTALKMCAQFSLLPYEKDGRGSEYYTSATSHCVRLFAEMLNIRVVYYGVDFTGRGKETMGLLQREVLNDNGNTTVVLVDTASDHVQAGVERSGKHKGHLDEEGSDTDDGSSSPL